MFLDKIAIKPGSTAANIVRQYYQTADVFRKYEIEYCCGGNWPLEMVCSNKGLAFDRLKKELEEICRVVQLPAAINYEGWNTDFLISYIINIHHQFLKTA